MMEIDMLDYFTLKVVNAFVAGSAIFLSIGIYPAPKRSPATSHRSRLESQEVKNYEKCNYWQARVDPSIKLPSDTVDLDETEEANTLEAIGCLLKLKGRTTHSIYSSPTVSFYLSLRFPRPTVEVAALYYASYLYYHNWQHAQAIILVDRNGEKNTKGSIKVAYEAYLSWFEKVKEIGLQKAREEKLDPLNGVPVRWY
jgi:hypothetical protein